MVEDSELTQIIDELCSLITRAWLDERLVKGLQKPSVSLQPADAALLLEKSIAPVGGREEKLNGPYSSALEKCTG